MTASITLYVPRVRCLDETGGSIAERVGNDEIYLGAVFVAVSANRGFDIRVVRSREVGGNFDDGETVNWARDLFSFDLGDASVYPYPKGVVAALVLAERDTGNGRNDILEKLAQQFRETLTDQLIKNLVEKAKTARGRPAANKAEEDSFIVGELKKYAADKLKELGDYLIERAKGVIADEVFPPGIKSLDISSENQTWNGSGDTPEEIAEFVGHDGKYQVTMYWKLRSPLVTQPSRPPVQNPPRR
ncbi:MAG: hypothetical protein CTY15_08300 [Methylocystis sp.]|nr:MAG: hypothetical protein CTY15_08300 [Methylocystis sp.]